MKAKVFSRILFACTLSTALFAQSDPPPTDAPAATDNAGDARRARRGNFNPAEAQARMMASLREQLVVKDDAEWSLIATRITTLMDLRRTGTMGGFGGGNNRGNRPGAVAAPEQEALRAALTDNLPDAEITARLARLRDLRKQNEAKLDQAREDLRAILTVRQEAVVVLAGLLN